MKLSCYLLLLLVITGFPLWGGSELSDLDCGSFRGEIYYYLDMFSGFGGGFDSSGQFRENPVLGRNSAWSQVAIGFSSQLSMDINQFNDYIDDEIEANIGGVSSDTLTIIFPQKKLRAGQWGGVRSFDFQLESGNAGFWGMSFWRPFGFMGSLTWNSLQMTMKTDTSLREEETRIVLDNDIAGEMSISLDQSRFAYGRSFSEGLQAAIGIDVLHLEMRADAESRTEGFIRQYGGDSDITQAFNNPTDSQYFRNTLDNEWRAAFVEDLFGWNAGISYQISPEVLLDLGFSQPLRQSVTGASEGTMHLVEAVNYEALTGESEDEVFDELLLEPSRMTYSNEVIYQCSSLILNYPGVLRLGLGLERGRTQHQFILATYLGELSLRYQGQVLENGREKQLNGFFTYDRVTESDYTYGIKVKSKLEYNLRHQLNQRLGIFMNLQYFTLGEIMKNILNDEGEEKKPDEMMTMFTFAAGLNYQFNERLRWNMRLLGFPGTFLDSRLIYRFGSGR
ncbi:MAG: hypothetical protein K9N06_03385 [Candidatus Cloacimonetes bacterium]|nr:hypothetical protein [Candidatus Cloacimonadota bacterium]